jgi:ribosome-binding ATPase YchF (GTP1/OBG family)
VKIGFTGVNLPEGKTKYDDPVLAALVEKDKPKKVSPYFAEFKRNEFVRCDAVVAPASQVLDVLILDMETLDSRLSRAEDDSEKELLARCIASLEAEHPLCDLGLSEAEADRLGSMPLASLHGVVKLRGDEDVNEVIRLALDKAGRMFFYTSGPTESHAWLVDKGATIVECAAAIHTDLAAGFIKGDVVDLDAYLAHHSFNDCRSKGVAKLVDRDYIIQPKQVIEIRFK